ncbi:cytochrome c [soil metagenome]
MLRKILKGIAIVLGSLIVLILIAGVVIYVLSEQRINKMYTVTVAPVTIPTAETEIREGERLAKIRGCTSCHMADLAGDSAFIAGAPVGTIPSANLTSGQGGRGQTLSDVDWVRAIRYGVNQAGRGLWIMPSHEYFSMSDQDLGRLIAYLKTIPAVDRVHPPRQLGPLFRTLLVARQLPLLAAEQIDLTAAPPAAPTPGETVEYGKYLAVTCSGCHGANYTGGPLPGAEPGSPEAANLTPGGVMKNYSEAQFVAALRTGIRPDGSAIPNEFMPWQVLGGSLTDSELKALYMFFQSLPTSRADAS